MNQLWSIYKTSQIGVEGSEAWQLAQKYPHAVSHDDINTVFVESLDNADNPLVLPDLPDDEMALVAAQWLFGESVRGMQLTQAQAVRLFTHPAHRLWCAKYDPPNDPQFEADYNYVGAFLQAFPHVDWPEFEQSLTPSDARARILAGLAAATQ